MIRCIFATPRRLAVTGLAAKVGFMLASTTEPSPAALDSAAPPSWPLRIEFLILAVVITFAAHALPQWAVVLSARVLPHTSYHLVLRQLGYHNYYLLWTLVYGLLLALPAPRRNGLLPGRIRQYFWPTLAVCGLPLILAAIVYPHLAVRPFSGGPIGLWLISPLAQDLVFGGFIYGHLVSLFPGHIHRRLPINRAIPIAGLFFAAWHLPNFESINAGYVWFQLGYTFLGFILVGLSRQWTGSILYATLSHMAGNYIAWRTP